MTTRPIRSRPSAATRRSRAAPHRERMRVAKTERRDPANRPASNPLVAVEREYRDAIRRAMRGAATGADFNLIRQALSRGDVARVVSGFDLAGFVEDYREESVEPVEEEADRSGARTAATIGAAAGATVAWDRRKGRVDEWVDREQRSAATRARDTAEGGIAEAVRRYQRAEVRPPDDMAAELLVESFGLGEREAGSAMQRFTSMFAEAETDAQRQRVQERALRHARQLADYAAERDARTKIMEASNMGREQAIAQAIEDGHLAANARKVWRTQVDPCEVCEELSGETVPFDGSFSIGKERPPAHPNCRCWIEPADVEEG